MISKSRYWIRSGILLIGFFFVFMPGAQAQITFDPALPAYCEDSPITFSYDGTGSLIVSWITLGGSPTTTSDSIFSISYANAGTWPIVLFVMESPFLVFDFITIVEHPQSPTINTMSPAGSPCEGEYVSATFNPGTGGVECGDEYQFSFRIGAAWFGPMPYFEGVQLPTGGMDEIYIEARRSGCNPLAGCTSSAWSEVARWAVTNDSQAPTITTCAADKILDAGPVCDIPMPDLTTEVVGDDNCTDPDSLIITQVPLAGTLIGTGATVVTLTVTDAGSNSVNCMATVTVNDVTDPVITVCPPPRNIVLDGSCGLLVPDLTGELSGIDNCTDAAALTISQLPLAGTVIPSGEGSVHTVVMTLDDGNGNSTTCDVSLTGDDASDPLITVCPAPRIITLDGTCGMTIPDLTSELTATDNCTAVGGLTITQLPTAGTLLASGEGVTQTVVMSVDDGNGNSSTCDVILTGDDATDPLITVCPPARAVILDGSCGLLVPDMTAELSALDNCAATLTITQLPLAGDVLPSAEGSTHTIVMSVDDGNGNISTCDVILTGDDATDPLITVCPLPRDIVLDGSCGLLVPNLIGELSATDNCTATGGLTVTQLPLAGAVLSSGEGSTHTIVMSVDDGNGNISTCDVVLTGDDDTDPLITVCPPARSIALDGSCGLLVPDLTGELSATDNCTASGALTVTQNPLAGTLLPSGEGVTHTVVMSVDDGNGNSSSCDVILTGDDNSDPIITVCPPDASVVVDGSGNIVLPDYTSLVSATDNCNSTPFITQSPAGGSIISGVGTVETITMTADDGNGNSTQCSFNITLIQLPPPIISCPGNVNEYVDQDCEFTLPDYRSLASVSGDTGMIQIPAIGTIYSGQGSVQTITLTAYNANGIPAS